MVRVDFGIEGKTAREAMNEATNIYPGGSFLVLSADEDENKFLVYSGKFTMTA